MKKTALIMLIVLFIGKCLGFLRDIVLSFHYGASAITDIYVISQTIPTVIFAFIGAGIATGFIPLYTEAKAEGGEARAHLFASHLANLLILISLLLIVIGTFFAEPLVTLFASGFGAADFALAVEFTRITIFSVISSAVVFIATAYLQIQRKYVLTAISNIPYNVMLILMIVVSVHYGIYWLAIGTVLGFFLQALFLLPFVYRSGYRHQFRVPWREPYVRKMFWFAIPVIIGVAAQQINVLIDRTLASHFESGSVSAIAYADRFQLFLVGLISVAVMSSVYPQLSELSVAKKWQEFARIFNSAVGILLLFIIPVALGALVFSESIMQLLFARGAFDDEDLQMTAQVFFYYSLGMPALVLRELLIKAFYAMKDNRTPVVNTLIAIALNIVLNLILSRYMGINGLALATSIANTVAVLLLAFALYRRTSELRIRDIRSMLIKVLIAAIAVVFSARVAFDVTHSYLSENIALLVAMMLAVLLYLGLAIVLKIEGTHVLIQQIRKRFHKK
jgi:putative peptidoglycan lipid II flippase